MFTIVRNLMNELMNDTNTCLSGNMDKQGCSLYGPSASEQYWKGNDCSRTVSFHLKLFGKRGNPSFFIEPDVYMLGCENKQRFKAPQCNIYP